MAVYTPTTAINTAVARRRRRNPGNVNPLRDAERSAGKWFLPHIEMPEAGVYFVIIQWKRTRKRKMQIALEGKENNSARGNNCAFFQCWRTIAPHMQVKFALQGLVTTSFCMCIFFLAFILLLDFCFFFWPDDEIGQASKRSTAFEKPFHSSVWRKQSDPPPRCRWESLNLKIYIKRIHF